jgi:hypothetical protein
MTDSRYADFRALREMAYADLSQAGILADWLKENDRERLVVVQFVRIFFV